MKKRTICIFFSLLLIAGLIGCKPAEQPAHKAEEAVKHEVHWGYEGEGAPAHWGTLKPEFELCGTGMSQSPIDLTKAFKADLNKIEFAYKDTPLKVINNGHAIQANYDPGSFVTIDGTQYQLLQLHFHAPSEHSVAGELYDMEMHLVHKCEKGTLAVVGVMMKKGKQNNVIQAIWDNIPTEVSKENVVEGLSLNASGLLPKSAGYFHYYGSLTTPPCSENVNWSVMKTPIEVSEEQIAKFRTVMGVETNRPVQPLNYRFLLESR